MSKCINTFNRNLLNTYRQTCCESSGHVVPKQEVALIYKAESLWIEATVKRATNELNEGSRSCKVWRKVFQVGVIAYVEDSETTE